LTVINGESKTPKKNPIKLGSLVHDTKHQLKVGTSEKSTSMKGQYGHPRVSKSNIMRHSTLLAWTKIIIKLK